MDGAPNQGRSSLKERLAAVRARIERAADRAGRAREACALLAVVKQRSDAQFEELLELGVLDLGENRVQGMLARPTALLERARVHLIGPLQTNKVRKAVRVAACFHALDSERLAALLEEELAAISRRLPVYLQVNVAGEAQKHGCRADEAASLARATARLPHLEVLGLMTIPPAVDDPEQSRPHFATLARLARTLLERGDLPATATGLSMGMSSDFEVAVEEGATLVRIGSALFDDASGAP